MARYICYPEFRSMAEVASDKKRDQTEVIMNPNTLNQAVINPIEIEKLLAMRETQKGLKERLALMEEAISQAEDLILSSIDAGADLSRLGYTVEVQESSRRYPAWKEHFISRLGKDAADAVLEGTKPTVFRKLVIK